MITFSQTKGRLTLNAEVQFIGQDVLIVLSGGNVPHIGTISSIGQNAPRQVYAFPSHSGRLHKDDVLAETFITNLQSYYPGNLVILSGFHQDGILLEEIQQVIEMANELSHQVRTYLAKNPIQSLQAKYQK